MRKYLVLILSFVLAAFGLNAQDSSYVNVLTGLDKVVGTYTFTGDADLGLRMGNNILSLRQRYRGIAQRSGNNSFRDNQNINFQYSYRAPYGVSLIAVQDWLLTADTKDIGINDLQRLSGQAGMRYDFLSGSYVQATAGIEKNRQISFESSGLVYDINGYLSDIELENFRLDAELNASGLSLESGRKSRDLGATIDLSASFDRGNSMIIQGGYNMQFRDFLTQISSSGEKISPKQTRAEENYFARINLDFLIIDELAGQAGVYISNMARDRYFDNSIDGVKNSPVTRQLSALELDINYKMALDLGAFRQSAELRYEDRAEQNNVSARYSITEAALLDMKRQDNNLDFQMRKTSLHSLGSYRLSPRDTVNTDLLVSITRYDTPSKENNDEWDKLYNIIRTGYLHRFGKGLWAEIALEYQYVHLVFLKSSRSMYNNSERTISLTPRVHVKNRFFEMNPELAISAKYTVYDYESSGSSPNSISLREMSYNDSLFIFIGKMFILHSGIKLRYYERGRLFWDSFAESPQLSSFEKFFRVIISRELPGGISAGIGGRYYAMDNNALGRYGLGGNQIETTTRAYGPETELKVPLGNGTELAFQGWYEFQLKNDLETKAVPFIFLTTRFILK